MSNIEETKQQIRGLVNEIAKLSKSSADADEFYAAFLQRVVSALAAAGGAVWVVQENQLELAYHINMDEELQTLDSDNAKRHHNLLQQILRGQKPQLIPPQSGFGDNDQIGNPTSHLLVLAPLSGEERAEGVVEVFQRADTAPNTQRGYLKFLTQMCDLAAEWVKTQKLKQISDRHSLWAQADHFSRMAHDNLDLRETAYTIVNEGRRMIGCDRVAVALQRGRKCTVEAISGQDVIENRSNIITTLNVLSQRIVATGESLWYDGATADLPPQVEKALDDYIDESYAKRLTVLPLRRPKREDGQPVDNPEAERNMEDNSGNEIIGALIIEQIESDIPQEVLQPRVDLVYEHSTRALSNALDHNNIFLMPVWRTIGKSRVLTNTRNLPKTLLALAALIVIIFVLWLFPKDLNMQAAGEFQPVERTKVFVPVNGNVDEVRVKDQQIVEAGDVLVILKNHDLDAEYQKLSGLIIAAQERESAALRTRNKNAKDMTPLEKMNLHNELLEVRQELKDLREQKKLLEKKISQLTITAPIRGMVLMSWEAENSLEQRPVQAGQILMTIANIDGPWELMLFMPEHRIAHVRKHFLTQRASDPSQEVDVTYVSATDPAKVRRGTIKRINDETELMEEHSYVIRVLVEIDKEDKEDEDLKALLRPGATVTAHAKCGRASLGYVWFHEAWGWMQKSVVFRFFR